MIQKYMCRWLAVVFLCLLMSLSATAAQTHDHDFVWIEASPTCTEDGYGGYKCSICGQIRNLGGIPQLGHDMSEWIVVQQPSCVQLGQAVSRCSRCDYVCYQDVDQLAHDYKTELVKPTCTQRGYVLHQCRECGNQLRTDYTDELGHSFSQWTVEPTCGRDGYLLHTCTICGYEKKTDRVHALGHNYIPEVIPPTCTADGYTRNVCTNCADSYRTDLVQKTGHRYNNGIITKAPTWTTMGRKTFTCTGCGDQRIQTTPKLHNPFLDITEQMYSYQSVIWAVGMELTKGVQADRFAPNDFCTRGQIVTFLWRNAGCPQPESAHSAFLDVQPGAYYRDAVLWAVEQGITNGVAADAFCPDKPCTRAQVVTFLWRAAGSPKQGTGATSFVDVSLGDYYSHAVAWAVKSGITEGVGNGCFAPNAVCTRGQIVTFLYRAQ